MNLPPLPPPSTTHQMSSTLNPLNEWEQPIQPVQPLGSNNSSISQATPAVIIVQPVQPTQYGNQNMAVPAVPLSGIEMTTPNSSNMPLATAQPITYIAQETFASHITTGNGKPTEYDHKNRIFCRSLFTNVLAIIVFSLFFAKLAWMRNIWLGSYNAAEWVMVKDPIYDGRKCSKKSDTSYWIGSGSMFELTSGSGSMEDSVRICDARCVAEATCVAYVLTTDSSFKRKCYGCNLALDGDNSVISSSSSDFFSDTAYKKIRVDSVTSATTSTTSTPSINITSTFKYLGCYKPPPSPTTDVDFIYTVPYDAGKYKAVPAFDRSLSGYHGWSNPSLFPLYIGCYQWSSFSSLQSSSIDMTYSMTSWKDSLDTYDSATECKDLCSKYKYFYISDSKKDTSSTQDSAPVCRCIDVEWSVINSGHLDERKCHPSNIGGMYGSSYTKLPLKYLIGSRSSTSSYQSTSADYLIGAFYKTSSDETKPIQFKRSVLTYYKSSQSDPPCSDRTGRLCTKEYVDNNLPTSGKGKIWKTNIAYSTPIDINPTDLNSGWEKLDDKLCGYDRRGGLKNQARAIYINPNVIKENVVLSNSKNSKSIPIDLDIIRYIPMLTLMICFPFLIMFYFWTSLASSQDLDYLSNIMRDVGDPNKSSAMEYFEKLKSEKCCLLMNIECYHHEQRTTGSGKNRSTKTVKVVTARGQKKIHFDKWWDETDTPTELERFEVVKVLCKLEPVSFADEASKINVEGQRARFKQEYQNRDRHMSYKETQIVNTFKRNILFIKDENRGGKNCDMLTQRMYYIMTALCLNWIYRYWFECAAVRTTVHVSKVIQVAANSMAGQKTGQKTNGNSNYHNITSQLQNLQVAFMNGQISAQVYDQARQALMAVERIAPEEKSSTFVVPVVPVARRPSLSAAEAMKVKKQGSGGCKNKCCCCFLALIFVVVVPVISYLVLLPCDKIKMKNCQFGCPQLSWCENNNDVQNPPLFSRTYQELQEAKKSSSISSGDSNIIEFNVKVNQLVRTDIEECVSIDTTTDDKTCDGPFSLINTCVKFEKLHTGNCQNLGSYAAATEMGCNELIRSTDAGRCYCGTADDMTVGIEVGCQHLPFTCQEICSKKCPMSGTCTEVSTSATETMAACIVPVYTKYSGETWKLSCQAYSKNAVDYYTGIPTINYPAVIYSTDSSSNKDSGAKD